MPYWNPDRGDQKPRILVRQVRVDTGEPVLASNINVRTDDCPFKQARMDLIPVTRAEEFIGLGEHELCRSIRLAPVSVDPGWKPAGWRTTWSVESEGETDNEELKVLAKHYLDDVNLGVELLGYVDEHKVIIVECLFEPVFGEERERIKTEIDRLEDEQVRLFQKFAANHGRIQELRDRLDEIRGE